MARGLRVLGLFYFRLSPLEFRLSPLDFRPSPLEFGAFDHNFRHAVILSSDNQSLAVKLVIILKIILCLNKINQTQNIDI